MIRFIKYLRRDINGPAGSDSPPPSRVAQKILSHFIQKQLKEREKMGWGWVYDELLVPLFRFMFPIFSSALEGWALEQ